MGSGDRSAFDPLDLEIIDHVYEAAWAKLLVRFSRPNGRRRSRKAEQSSEAAVRARPTWQGGFRDTL